MPSPYQVVWTTVATSVDSSSHIMSSSCYLSVPTTLYPRLELTIQQLRLHISSSLLLLPLNNSLWPLFNLSYPTWGAYVRSRSSIKKPYFDSRLAPYFSPCCVEPLLQHFVFCVFRADQCKLYCKNNIIYIWHRQKNIYNKNIELEGNEILLEKYCGIIREQDITIHKFYKEENN